MAVTQKDPNTIWLGGPRTEIGDLAAEEAITPGHLVERHVSAGVIRWRKHATAAVATARAVATEQSMLNQGVDDAYAAGDLMEVSEGAGGSTFWMLIASGQTIVAGDKLESAGNGTLRVLASGVALFSALEAKTATALTRIRVEVV
jgi:hypothetical protein